MIPQDMPPPPQTESAEIQIISNDHQQRLESPLQNAINNFNPNGAAPTISFEQAKDVQPDRKQQTQDLINRAKDLSEAAAAAREAKNNAGRKRDKNSAVTADKNVAAGTGPEPHTGQASANKGIEAYRQKVAAKQTGTNTQNKVNEQSSDNSKSSGQGR